MPIDLKEVARSVVRIPVAGPSPNNTLVFVTAKFASLTQTYSGEHEARALAIWESAYQIAGFDQTRADEYLANTKWSVAVTMNYLSTEDDQTFSVSVDNVEGHLSSDGKFYVSADISGHTSGEVLSYNLSMAAYILTQEPQPDFTRPPRFVPTLREKAKVHSTYLQEHGRLATNKAAAGLPLRKAKRIIDDCV